MSRRHQRGNTFLGIVIGIAIGLTIAAGIALFISKAPNPFSNQNKDNATAQRHGASPPARSSPAPSPAPSIAPSARDYAGSPDWLPSDKPSAEPRATEPARKAPPAESAPPSSPSAEQGAADASSRLFLQAGAFKSQADADAMKARLALMGYDAKVSSVVRGSDTWYRVRLGPYAGAERADKVRQSLAQNGIKASVVKAAP
ncbi:MAG TPA: SPOR domain-containing protein [Burkholderiaceae bacterium]|nr:SPOR domain-containing protein [Burkholderiaceae bacterium]